MSSFRLGDKLGVNSTTEITAALNYRLRFLRSKLSFGMQGGMATYRYDYTKLNTEVVDQKIIQSVENYTRPNLGAGIFYKADTYYFGISVPRFFNIYVQDGVSTSTRYRRHLYFSGGYVFEHIRGIKFKPSFLLRVVDQVKPSLDLNMQVLFLDVLWAGVVVRNFNSIGLISQIEISQKFRAGYLFELPTGKLASSSFGTHEFMLSLDLAVFQHQVAYKRYF